MTTSTDTDPVICKFIEYQPSAIKILASTVQPLDPLNPTISEALSARLAVYREQEHRLEILNPSSDWSIETRITTGVNEADIIEAMCWTCNGRSEDFQKITWPVDLSPVNTKSIIPPTNVDTFPQHRLFTATPDGVIKEWDWKRGITLRQTEGGSAIWSMCRSPDNRFLAAGHEDGRVRIYKLMNINDDNGDEDCLELDRTFEASAITSIDPERIISIAWSGDRIATGYQFGMIKLWDIRTGRSLGQLDLQSGTVKPSINCLHFLDTKTLVSGDSTGHVNFWDVTVKIATNTLKTHDADILCMAGQGDMLFASGVDHRTVKLALINSNGIETWTVVSGRRQHTNDVRSMCLTFSFHMNSDKELLQCRPLLVSGGIDTNLELSDPLQTQQSNLDDRRFDDFPTFQRQVIRLRNDKIFALVNNRKTFEIWTIDGKKRAVINTGIVHDWQVDDEGLNLMIITGDNRCKHFVIAETEVSVKLIDTPNDCHLKNICHTQGNWFIRAIRSDKNVFIKNGREIFAVPGEMLDRMMCLGPNLICLIDTDNRIHRWTKTACLDVLQLPCRPVAACVTTENVLIIITADNHVWRVCEAVEPFNASAYSQEWFSLNNRFIDIIPEDEDLWISSITSIQHLKSGTELQQNEQNPKKKIKRSSKNVPTSGPFDIHKPFLFFGIQHGKRVIVRRPWTEVIAALPPAFQRRKYGIS